MDWIVGGLVLALAAIIGSEMGFRRLDRDIEKGRTSEARVFFRLPFWELLPYEAYPEHRRTIRLGSKALGAAAAFIVAYIWLAG